MGALVDAIDAMERDAGDAILFALMDAGQLVVTGAKSGHPWQNRMGRLEAAIRTDGVRGSLRGGYRLRVVGATRYGSYLEEGWEAKRGDYHRDAHGNEIHLGTTTSETQWAFLLPAWERVEEQVARDGSEAMASAANRA